MIKDTLKKSELLSRSLLWQLLAIWQTRLNLLSTVYKNEKIAALKHYFINDREYIKTKKEINAFKTKKGYDFAGILLPDCVVTPDYFLNVLKPHVEGLVYQKDSITEFYRQQKNKYKTLVYCKDVCIHGEPKYIGAHMVSHGFTYFFNEISINKGDVVVDLGSAPGDFAALCLYKGAAQVYAFEPEESKKSDLIKLSHMNNNKIEVVRSYAGLKSNEATKTVSLDEFVIEKKIPAINFIKADIEGNEASMLRGATEILRTSKPKLAICAYHIENDAEELRAIILAANPTYTVYKEDGVIYAF